MSKRQRILFFAEAVTLAHLARPLQLASCLDASRFEVVLACDDRYRDILNKQKFTVLPLHSLSSELFLDALAKGRPVYDLATLENYVEEDIQLIDQVQPDAVVGDFRLSLSVSARLRGVPYLALANAYWSPYARQTYLVPTLPFVHWTGARLGTALFRLARPMAFAMHCLPLNRLRKNHGLTTLGLDLRQVYTEADITLYADVPEMIPTYGLPSHHHYIGPILWSPPTPLPDWWPQLPTHRPIVYMTLGSSGDKDFLPRLVEACSDLPITLLVAAAGAIRPHGLPGNVYWSDYLPGTEVAIRASLFICNGGSPSSHQALAAGIPVLGIAGNLDQFLNMQAIIAVGAGHLMRQDSVSITAVHAVVKNMLHAETYKNSAKRVSGWFAQYSSNQRFSKILGELIA